ncbi:hypothetical protein [Acetobacter indonesiensis]|nr:hypothetical protein [Acetobacter indonesiensis]
MPRVLPSQVIEYLNIGNRPRNITGAGRTVLINALTSGYLSGLVRLIQEIPNEYIAISGRDYTNLIFSVESIKNAVEHWRPGQSMALQPHSGKDVLELIHSALVKCPDAMPSPTTTELPFVDDEEMRKSIRADLSSAASALRNGEWKAATVLAGSVCEALLLWAIPKAKDYDPQEIKDTRGNCCAPENLELAAFIDRASALKIITTGTRDIAHRARNYRNLIHAGRARRLAQDCDRASALAALAAAESIIRNLKMASEAANGLTLTDAQLAGDASQYAKK